MNEERLLNTLIPAEELRDISNMNRVKHQSEQLADIIQRMHDAALDGKYEIEVFYELIPDIKQTLQRMGYRISWRISSADVTRTVINWGKK